MPKAVRFIIPFLIFLYSCASTSRKIDDKVPSVLSQIKLTAPDFTAREPKVSFTGYDYLKLEPKDRVKFVYSFIEAGKRRGVIIKKGANFYYKKLEYLFARHANKPDNLRNNPIFTLLKTQMILEYDWARFFSDSVLIQLG